MTWIGMEQNKIKSIFLFCLQGSLCHPYMSLQQHDLLQDINVRSFVIGATNALFKHHKHLMDVIIEVGKTVKLVESWHEI